MEYVSKMEVKPVRKTFDDKIREVRKSVKEKGITFVCMLVGSAKRNLVVRHYNKGFDCDYQIIIKKDKNFSAKELKDLFMKAFDVAFANTTYDYCEDSKNAITIKEKDKENHKILNGYDVVILKEYDDGYKILRNNKSLESEYKFEKLPKTRYDYEKVKKIKGVEMWQNVREIYLEKKKKNESTLDKKSFQLYIETINEAIDMID